MKVYKLKKSEEPVVVAKPEVKLSGKKRPATKVSSSVEVKITKIPPPVTVVTPVPVVVIPVKQAK